MRLGAPDPDAILRIWEHDVRHALGDLPNEWPGDGSEVTASYSDAVVERIRVATVAAQTLHRSYGR